MADTHEIVELVSKLVRIDLINPWLVKGGAGEAGVAKTIADWLKPLGVKSQTGRG